MSSDAYPDFDAVMAQDPDELRRLLSEGEPVERAWAGWALALHLGRASDEALTTAAHGSPTPGVRTLLVTILAGHGERDLVEAFARDDPDDDVRAAACRTLAAITLPDDQRAGDFLVACFEADSSPIVRLAILRLVEDGRVELPVGLVEGVIDAPVPALRAAAASVLLASGGALPDALRTRAFEEPDEVLRERILGAWIRSGGSEDILRVAAGTVIDDGVLVRTLASVASEGGRFPWPLLGPLAGRSARVDRRLVELVVDPAEPAARRWLLDAATSPLDGVRFSPDGGARSEHRHAARVRLLGSLGDVDPSTMDAEELDMVRVAVVDWFWLGSDEPRDVMDRDAAIEEARRVWRSIAGGGVFAAWSADHDYWDMDSGLGFDDPGTESAPFADMPARDLREHFGGNAFLTVEGLDVHWTNVPLLDLGLALRAVGLAQGRSGGRQELAWLSSEGTLTFERIGGEVRVSASDRSGVGRIDHPWLANLTEGYLRRLVLELGRRYPALLDNPSFLLLLA